MTTTNISINESSSDVISCTLSYSREGYIPWAIVFGDTVKIETTLFKSSSFADSVKMNPQWVGEATATEKNEDPTKTDIYSRFSTDPLDEKYTALDNVQPFGTILNANDYAPRMYRGFISSTYNYDSSGEAISASAMIKDGTTWKFTGELGIGARFENGAVPYIRLQGGKRELEFTYKDSDKAITCIIEGATHLKQEAYSVTNDPNGSDPDWFIPFTVSNTDRFKFFKVEESYRTNPSNTPTSDTTAYFRDDSEECLEYANDILQTSTIPSVYGSIDILGSKQYSIGEQIGQIVTRNGTCPVNLAIVDQSTQYAPPRQAGGSGQDTVTIELGRK